MKNINVVCNWLTELKKSSGFKTTWISQNDSKEWSIKKGRICHKTNHFFKIIGIRYTNLDSEVTDQPIILQKEIGTLGFLMREHLNNKEILVQAKIEPGNTNIIQLAPTCQATKSNAMCYHGGAKPPFYCLFNKQHPKIIYSSLQSEQGSRFYKKRNRNMLAISNDDYVLTENYRWLSIDLLLKLLGSDYLVNTDARSVMVCSPWEKLVNRIPFSQSKTSFARALLMSYQQNIKTKQFIEMNKELCLAQKTILDTKIMPLEQLKDWKVTCLGVKPMLKKKFSVRYLNVTTKSREVASWDQPIIDSYGGGSVDLVCGRIDGVLHFNFIIINEPGLCNNAELSPTICVEPGCRKKTDILKDYPRAKVVKSVLQSDEGGRFYQDTTKYRIIDIGEADMNLPGYWLNLAQIQDMLLKDGWFTNESRSVLSLLLWWM